MQQEPQRVTTKDPKKVEVGKRLAAINCKKREEAQNGGMNQYYGMGAGCSCAFSTILAVGVIGGLGYYIYRTKKGEEVKNVYMPRRDLWSPTLRNPTISQPLPRPQANKFDMD